MPSPEISTEEITRTVRRLCIEANTVLGEDVLRALRESLEREASPTGRDIFRQLIENARIAREEEIPLCQDTGMAIVFISLGQEVRLVGGDLSSAVEEGVRQGYRDGFLRKSTLHPLTRVNPGDNTPAILHVEIVPGNRIHIAVAAKGFGSENMSRVTLFPPAAGIEGIKNFVLERVEEAGANPCPPLIIGIGIGGNLEMAGLIAKKSLLRPLGVRHPDPEAARLEIEILDAVNRLGIGPQGLGGSVTALDVHIETYPTHIASLPVAVNLQCHSNRHKEAVLQAS